MNKGLHLLSVMMLAATLGVPLMAQSITLKANIPFEFTVGEKTLPPGEYLVRNGSSSVLFLQGTASHAAVLTLARCEVPVAGNPAGNTRLTFNRYGSQYFLSEVDEGYVGTGFVLPMSRAQKEAAKTASLRHYDVVAVLAQH